MQATSPETSLSNDLLNQLHRLQHDVHAFYQPDDTCYTTWKEVEMIKVNKMLERWREKGDCVVNHHDYHQQFDNLVEKLVSYDFCEKLHHIKQGDIQVSSTILTTASQKLLKEFGLRYGVGEVYRKITVLFAVIRLFQINDWYLSCLEKCFVETVEFIEMKERFIFVKEKEIMKEALDTLHDHLEYIFVKLFYLYNRQLISKHTVDILVKLLRGLLHAKVMFRMWCFVEKRTVRKQTSDYIELAAKSFYIKRKALDGQLTPKLLRLLLQDAQRCFQMTKEMFTPESTLQQCCIDLDAKVAKTLYHEFMLDFHSMSYTMHLKEVNFDMLFLINKINMLDIQWKSYIPESMHEWRESAKLLISELLLSIASKLVRMSDDFIKSESFDIFHISHIKYGSVHVPKPLKTTDIRHDKNRSPFTCMKRPPGKDLRPKVNVIADVDKIEPITLDYHVYERIDDIRDEIREGKATDNTLYGVENSEYSTSDNSPFTSEESLNERRETINSFERSSERENTHANHTDNTNSICHQEDFHGYENARNLWQEAKTFSKHIEQTDDVVIQNILNELLDNVEKEVDCLAKVESSKEETQNLNTVVSEYNTHGHFVEPLSHKAASSPSFEYATQTTDAVDGFNVIGRPFGFRPTDSRPFAAINRNFFVRTETDNEKPSTSSDMSSSQVCTSKLANELNKGLQKQLQINESFPENGIVLMTNSLADLLTTCHKFSGFVTTLSDTLYPRDQRLAYTHAKLEMLEELFIGIGSLVTNYSLQMLSLDLCGVQSLGDEIFNKVIFQTEPLRKMLSPSFKVKGCRHSINQDDHMKNSFFYENCQLLHLVKQKSEHGIELTTRQMCYRVNNSYCLTNVLPIIQQRCSTSMDVSIDPFLEETEKKHLLTYCTRGPCESPVCDPKPQRLCRQLISCEQTLDQVFHAQLLILSCRIGNNFSKIFDGDLSRLEKKPEHHIDRKERHLRYLCEEVKMLHSCLYFQCYRLLLIAVFDQIVQKFHKTVHELLPKCRNLRTKLNALNKALLGIINVLTVDPDSYTHLRNQSQTIVFRIKLLCTPLNELRNVYEVFARPTGQLAKILKDREEGRTSDATFEETIVLLKRSLPRKFTGKLVIEKLTLNDQWRETLVEKVRCKFNSSIGKKCQLIGNYLVEENILVSHANKSQEKIKRPTLANITLSLGGSFTSSTSVLSDELCNKEQPTSILDTIRSYKFTGEEGGKQELFFDGNLNLIAREKIPRGYKNLIERI